MTAISSVHFYKIDNFSIICIFLSEPQRISQTFNVDHEYTW